MLRSYPAVQHAAGYASAGPLAVDDFHTERCKQLDAAVGEVEMAGQLTSSAGYGMTSVDMKVRLYCPNSTSEQSRHVSIKSQPFELPGHGITLITVQDLQIHYQHAAGSTKKLNFLGPDREQLPGPLWDPETWTSPRRLAASGKLVYVATDRHKQQQVIKFTKQLDNILVLVEAGHVKQLRLVNFDWAGVAGSTQYPVLLNAKTIVWPEGVGPGDPLQQKHDIELLQYQVSNMEVDS
ncbi:hypothetical protein WJX77_011443 [Trebouxia sp. C0004]